MIQSIIDFNARHDDPETSKLAARNAEEDSAVGIRVVAVMRGAGVPMIDCEIYAAYIAAGYRGSDGRVRHGRKWGVARGYIVATGVRRKTSMGGMSTEWKAV